MTWVYVMSLRKHPVECMVFIERLTIMLFGFISECNLIDFAGMKGNIHSSPCAAFMTLYRLFEKVFFCQMS